VGLAKMFLRNQKFQFMDQKIYFLGFFKNL